MNTTRPHGQFRRQSGVTLVESAAALAIVAVMAGVAVPTFDEVRATRTLEAAAAQLRTDVHHARSAAVAMGQVVRLQLVSVESGSCWLVHTGKVADCQCTPTGVAQCADPAQLLSTRVFAKDQPMSMGANVPAIGFDPLHGTATPTGSITLSNGRGDALKVVVSIMGRARTCLATGALRGYPAC